ncbi:SDR family oxidoreductase [Marinobacter zhejiangensis]|uniref:NAD(P)-dependent dehydrogenase, short-chain alcohol dehydrogenase family n=1 Tax=Marinobacter zhejiangensis TaxID=488535 RepID=A0A1I4RZI3_9GAMM|nr:SDR family oxidoreductase [Marinobacter zhejiangensis]SFM57619.1 NAD(P)-dependent dehydrogenase, short-chain alcohol dehydrogenase family [Marinobacter zhejiangensis]
MQDLKEKVVIVTGGAASIGEGIVRHLHACGATVVVAARSEGRANELVKDLGDRACFIKTDLKNDDEIERLIKETHDRFSKIDVLVNNACVYGDEGASTSRKTWLDTLNVNIVSAAILGEIARPFLAKAKGAIVNIGSVSGQFPHAGRWAYPVSKAALKHLTKAQAVDYAKEGIRVNLAVLGHIWSDPISNICNGSQEKADQMSAPYNMLSRVGSSADVGAVVAFLASSNANYITGAELHVDGGYSSLGPEGHAPLQIPE